MRKEKKGNKDNSPKQKRYHHLLEQELSANYDHWASQLRNDEGKVKKSKELEQRQNNKKRKKEYQTK